MLSKDLEVTLNLAFKEARSKRHEWMTVEHLLLALLDNTVAVDVLKAVGADIDRLRKELHEFIESTTPLIPARSARVLPVVSSATPAARVTAHAPPKIQPTAEVERPANGWPMTGWGSRRWRRPGWEPSIVIFQRGLLRTLLIT